MSALQNRLVMSAIFVSISLVTIFWAPEWLFILVIEGFCLVAFYEYLEILRKKGIVFSQGVAYASAFLIPIMAGIQMDPLILVFACVASFVVYFQEKEHTYAMVSTAMVMFGLVYVVWFLSHLIKLRDFDYGPAWVFYTILIVKGGDAGAYFVGSRYGSIKLCETISPNKSVEGAWGGLATSVILSLFSGFYLHHVSLGHLFFLGIILGVVAQLGDLIESLMKRDVGIKDSGAIPGLGGILDVLDSLLLTVPITYYYKIFFLGS